MCRTGVLLSVAVVFVVSLSAGLAMAQGRDRLQVTLDANDVWVRAGESPVLRYRYNGVPFKPYVKELYTPSGLNVLLDAPPDHLHHHGLMFAVAVDGENFWEETPTAGHQRHNGFLQTDLRSGSRSWVGFIEQVRWIDVANHRLLDERRTIKVRQTQEPEAALLTWQSRLSVPDGKASVTLGGSHYFGLGMRFIRSMDVNGEFRNLENVPGTIFRGEERLTDADWCAYTAGAGDKVVTVAMFGHPDNRRQPTTWFTMATPFAYLAGTMRLHEMPVVVSSNEPLILQYGLAVWDGRTEMADIETMYRKWLSQENVHY